MKFLLDCVVTSSHPGKCSSNVQFLTLAKTLLEEREDVFIYWLIPEWVTDEHFEAVYPQDSRVTYARVPQSKDRTKEYLTLSKELDAAVAFNGPFWDWDVLVTVRAGLVPVLKMIATSPRAAKLNWLKEVWLIEMMSILSFKKTVLNFGSEVENPWTLNGYLAADRVWLSSQRDHKDIVRLGMAYLPPSRARLLDTKIVPAGYAQSTDLFQKTEDQYPDPTNEKPFCLAHAGRIEKSNRIELINELMVKQFVMKGSKMTLLVCTVSDAIKAFDTSVVDIQQVPREVFWDYARNDMHLIINMSDEGGSAMSLLEPMMLGVPAIIGPKKQMGEVLGHDYPFLVNNLTEAYAWVNQFYDDYPAMYAKWAEWQTTSFAKMVKERYEEGSLYKLVSEAAEQATTIPTRFKEERPNKVGNRFVLDVLEEVGDAKEFVLKDVVGQLVEKGKVSPIMLQKMFPEDRRVRHLAFCSYFQEYRIILKAFHGWEDASVAVGHMRKV